METKPADTPTTSASQRTRAATEGARSSRPAARAALRSSPTSDQILVERIDVLVGGHDALDRVARHRNAGQHTRELLPVARQHEQSQPIIVQLDLGNVILLEQHRGDPRSVAASDQELARMLADLLAHA